MDILHSKDLRALAEDQSSPCVSLYFPTHTGSVTEEYEPTRLRRLLDRAEGELLDKGVSAPAVKNMLRPARGLSENKEFWRRRSQGLAIFISPAHFGAYRLPSSFSEMVAVHKRFYLKQLLSVVDSGRRFLLLALSQNKVRLFAVTRYAIEELHVEGMPSSMDELLNYTSVDRGEQVHSAMRGGALGKEAAVFHGQGGEPDSAKSDLTQYFHAIDNALHLRLREEQVPLVLAGVQYLLPIYREVNSYPEIAKEELHGNCDLLAPRQLHDLAWPIMAPNFASAQREAAAKYRQLAGTGRTSDHVLEIAAAAAAGRIETLFVTPSSEQWGMIDKRGANAVACDRSHPGAEDLSEWAVCDTLSQGGAVFAVAPQDAPVNSPIAATYRY